MHLKRKSRDGIPALLRTAPLILLLASGCSRQTPSREYAARVGSVELTQDALARAGDSLGIARGRSRALVDEWVVSELLYQEAQRRGLTDADQFRSRLEAARKQLAIEELLQTEVYGDSGGVREQDASSFFGANISQFTLKEEVVRASYALFSERDAANLFRSRILRGASWDEALRQIRSDSLNGRFVRSAASGQYFTQATLYPEELWKLARTLGKDEVSFAVKTSAGYYVIIVHGVKHAGEAPDFDYVKNSVRDRLMIEQRRARYNKFVADLRSRHSVDVAPGNADTASAPGD